MSQSTEALSKIASVVSRPLYTDRVTADMERIAYARVLVETNVSQPLIDSIDIVTLSGSIHKQYIEYDWKPRYCTSCLKFGHWVDECRNKIEEPQQHEEFQEAPRRGRRNRRPARQGLTVKESEIDPPIPNADLTHVAGNAVPGDLQPRMQVTVPS
ncbi:uncharacterized protein LOC132612099 [Lycium barbarum]|uniref:uncharacterized protein LOC132612099 n=1 Tax=Lycium barbarum TaxID=112863 RepID=UPI00293F219E|nr:uncharacterized protein LOC132612099 [Lycium barbarum]